MTQSDLILLISNHEAPLRDCRQVRCYTPGQSHFLGHHWSFVLTGPETAIVGILEVGSSDNSRGNSAGEAKTSHDGDQEKRWGKLHVVKRFSN
jgi:hypothetical protein